MFTSTFLYSNLELEPKLLDNKGGYVMIIKPVIRSF